jgi:hypothetical protein
VSFLAPLYVAGVLAVALPILFHLIRRTPRGRQDFSSLMFLAPSPPRITRRSRLNNIILLLLRAAALTLLAFAFARPFFRQGAETNVDKSQGRRVAILVDTSASMRRGDLWRQAVDQAEQAISALTPADDVALFFADRTVRSAMTFAEASELDHPRRVAMLRARLAEAAPTWDATRLGDALATVADQLAEDDTSKDKVHATAPGAGRQLVLISDMQEGGHIDALQGHQCPQAGLLDVQPVALTQSPTAALHTVTDAADESAEADTSRLRVRVTNQPDSTHDQFALTWADARGPLPGLAPVNVYVPAGRSQVVRVPWPPPDHPANRLVLTGDDFDFDNTVYVVPPRKEQVRVVFLGDDAADDTRGLRYYLESALAETPRRKADVVARKAADPLAEAELQGTRLVVVGAATSEPRAAVLRKFAESGGDVLWVLRDVASAPGLAALTGAGELQIAEAPKSDFALLGRVDTRHPLFSPFGDARFGDFTRIHFWGHRLVRPDALPDVRVVAAFDNGDPFLLEQPVGRGRVLVATSGWQPADSQLALSTKFVPLLDRILRRDEPAQVRAAYAVHDPVSLPADGASPKRTVQTPDGRQIDLPATASAFEDTAQPGIYRLTLGERELPLAVNLAADESRTAPLAVEELEQWGAKLGNKPAPDELASRQRQLQVMELENRQKLWRWLIVVVIGLLFAETALAGALTRRALRQQPEPQQVVA